MPRSVKKGPFVDYKLAGKIDQLNSSNQKKIIKTWSRASLLHLILLVILSQFIMVTK
jgi:small subunit ribosomal protein S19